MSYTSGFGPIGRFYSTNINHVLQQLTTREAALQHRIDNQIHSLLATAGALNATQGIRRKVVALKEHKENLECMVKDLEKQISHKAFLFPEETPMQDRNTLRFLKVQLAKISRELDKFSVKNFN